MAYKINLKISQRHDVLSNWTSKDPVLLDGELIAVECQDQTRFKLGDGTKKFSQLEYVDQKVIESQRAQFGTTSKAQSTGSFATGYNAQANGLYSIAAGYKATAKDQQSFVWSGQTGNTYESKGQGAFAIDPVNGISGTFVGASSLWSHLCSQTFPLSSKANSLDSTIEDLSGEVKTISSGLDTRLTTATSNITSLSTTLSNALTAETDRAEAAEKATQSAVDKKIYIDDTSATSLSIQHISRDAYHQKVLDGTALSNVMYVVSAETQNMYGQKIEHMADGVAADDAATVGQVASVSSDLTGQISKKATAADLSAYVKTSVLTAYAPTTSLTAYAKTSDLSPYAKTSSLTAYAQNTSLTAYAQTSSLTAYALSTDAALLPTSAEVSNIVSGYGFNKNTINLRFNALSARFTHLSASRYRLVDAALTQVGTSGMSCAVEDQTVTRIVISSSSTPVSVQLPPRPTGTYLSSGARDFVMRIEVTVSAVPTVTFFGGISGSGYEPVSFDAEDDSWCVLEQGLNVISFTETKRA